MGPARTGNTTAGPCNPTAAWTCKGRTISSEQLVFSPVKRVRIRIALPHTRQCFCVHAGKASADAQQVYLSCIPGIYVRMRSLFVLNLPMARDGRKYICPHIPMPFTGRDGVFRRIIRPAPGNSHLACRSHKKGANKGLPSFRKVGGEGKGGMSIRQNHAASSWKRQERKRPPKYLAGARRKAVGRLRTK